MFDAISNFVVYLQERLETSNDPGEIVRLRKMLEKAMLTMKKMEAAETRQIEV